MKENKPFVKNAGVWLIAALLVLTTIVMVPMAIAQPTPPYTVDFTLGIPSDWTILDGGTTSDTWWYDTFFGSPDYGATCDSDAAGNGVTMDEELISPVIDCIGLSSVTLEYDHFFNGGSGAYTNQGDVYVELDGIWGTTPVMTYLPGSSASGGETIPISLGLATNLRIKFHFQDFGSWGYGWSIFNVEVYATPLPCPLEIKDPTGVDADGIYVETKGPNEFLVVEVYNNQPGSVSSVSWSLDFDFDEGSITHWTTGPPTEYIAPFTLGGIIGSIAGYNSEKISIKLTGNACFMVTATVGCAIPKTVNGCVGLTICP